MNHSNSGLAHGTNGSPQLTLENGEMAARAKENEARLSALISNKFPNDNQRGKKYDFTVRDGRIILKKQFPYSCSQLIIHIEPDFTCRLYVLS